MVQPKCRTAKRELNKAARATSNFPTNDHIRTNYYKVKKSYKLLIKRWKTIFFDKLNKDIEEGKILNWQQFKKLNTHKSNKIEFDSYDMHNFETFFTNLYSDKHRTVSSTDKQTYMSEADTINKSSPSSPTLNAKILLSEVKDCIYSLKTGKASSLDMINNEILKSLNDNNISF